MKPDLRRDAIEILRRLYDRDDSLIRAHDATDEDLAHIRAELVRMGLIETNKRGDK